VPIIRVQIVSEARALLDESGLDGLTLARRLGVKAPTLYWHVRDKADLRDAIAEYLVPEHLAFVLYAATGGDFVLGGMQALFEHDLHLALDEVAHGERRCQQEPKSAPGSGSEKCTTGSLVAVQAEGRRPGA
jgi:AcrR family transcriptional regulator